MSEQGWQTIDTAPIESEVLVWNHGLRFVAIHSRGIWISIPGGYGCRPSHWAPLPEPPR